MYFCPYRAHRHIQTKTQGVALGYGVVALSGRAGQNCASYFLHITKSADSNYVEDLDTTLGHLDTDSNADLDTELRHLDTLRRKLTKKQQVTKHGAIEGNVAQRGLTVTADRACFSNVLQFWRIL